MVGRGISNNDNQNTIKQTNKEGEKQEKTNKQTIQALWYTQGINSLFSRLLNIVNLFVFFTLYPFVDIVKNLISKCPSVYNSYGTIANQLVCDGWQHCIPNSEETHCGIKGRRKQRKE